MDGFLKQLLKISVPCTIFLCMNILFTHANPIIPYTGLFVSTASEDLGSVSYCLRIQNHAAEFGSEAALERIKQDVEEYGGQLDKNTYEDNLRFYRLVSYYISQVDAMDETTHYFRNKLNRAPATLKEMLQENSKLQANRRWRIMPVKSSLYHMQGKDGIYNIKFVSCDGFCEAVYNKRGELLTDQNDPVNMGTFNFAPGISQFRAHEKYDINPYLEWGNTANSPQKGEDAIREGIVAAAAKYNKSIETVQKYRDKVTALFIKKV